jgi:hypothetical protein
MVLCKKVTQQRATLSTTLLFKNGSGEWGLRTSRTVSVNGLVQKGHSTKSNVPNYVADGSGECGEWGVGGYARPSQSVLQGSFERSWGASLALSQRLRECHQSTAECTCGGSGGLWVLWLWFVGVVVVVCGCGGCGLWVWWLWFVAVVVVVCGCGGCGLVVAVCGCGGCGLWVWWLWFVAVVVVVCCSGGCGLWVCQLWFVGVAVVVVVVVMMMMMM